MEKSREGVWETGSETLSGRQAGRQAGMEGRREDRGKGDELVN